MHTSTVLAKFKTKVAIARALGLTKGAISMWGDRVPENSARRLEKITDGELRVIESLYRKTA